MPSKEMIFHFALTGHKLADDWNLIQRLKALRHRVTLLKREDLSTAKSILESVDVFIQDCSSAKDLESEVLSHLREWRDHIPRLRVVLIDGGLTQEEIASAFKVGIRDYFPDPYDVNLLVERILYLASPTGHSASEGEVEQTKLH